MLNVVPGVSVNAKLAPQVTATGKLDAVLLMYAFPKWPNAKEPTDPILSVEDDDTSTVEPNFKNLGATGLVSDMFNETAIREHLTAVYNTTSGPYADRFTAIADAYSDSRGAGNELSEAQQTAYKTELKEILVEAAYMVLKQQYDQAVQAIRGISRNIQIWIGYSFYDAANTDAVAIAPGLMPGEMEESKRAAVYDDIFDHLDLNKRLPLAVVVYPQETFFTPYNDYSGGGRYQNTLNTLNNEQLGLLAFLNGPFPETTDGFFMPKKVAATEQINRAENYAEALTTYLQGLDQKMKGFASMWHGFSINPPTDTGAQSRLYHFHQGLVHDPKNDQFRPDYFRGNYMPLSLLAAAHAVRMNQEDLGYLSPSGQDIRIPKLADFSRVRLKRATEILKTSNFNYGWELDDGFTIQGGSTLDPTEGWRWINTRIAVSVLRFRLVQAAVQVQFSPSDPSTDSAKLDLAALAAQACTNMTAEGGLIPGENGGPSFNLEGPVASVEEGTLTLKVWARFVGLSVFVNVDIVSTKNP